VLNSAKTNSSLLSRLIAGEKILDPVAIVVAHPDDETIGMGGRILCFETLTLIHATNGAPNWPAWIQKTGFDSAEAYSAARFSELDQALRITGARPFGRVRYDYTDGDLVFHLVELTERLQVQLRGVNAVITHAYEGGHPDHDACAFAVQYATRRLAESGIKPLQRMEFASYFSLKQRLHAGSFWPDQHNPGYIARLTRNQRRLKKEALKTFTTQQSVLKPFGVRREMYRHAPYYDFRSPAPPGTWLYDANEWPITGRDWLGHAGRALDQLDNSNPARSTTTGDDKIFDALR
jgi:N-acetylglucosamine malate deacetylase 2